jgi:hypothetical protein
VNMKSVQSDYAMLLLKIEKSVKKAHDHCLKKEWSAAGKNILIADAYCASLLEWLDNQKEGQEGKFEAVNVKDV